MTEGRNGIPLASRRAEGLMPLPVTDRRATITPDPSLLTAGADEAKADPAQRVAADPSVIDAERDPLYGDRVDRHLPIVNYGTDPHKTWKQGVAAAGKRESEKIRRARLSRWQEQR